MLLPLLAERLRHPLGQAILVALAHATACVVGMLLAPPTGGAPLLWPAVGVLVGALLVLHLPRALLAGVCWAGGTLVTAAFGMPPGVAAITAALGVAEALLVAWLMPRARADVRHLTDASAIFLLGGVSVVGCAAVGLIAAAVTPGGEGAAVAPAWRWLTWTAGHALGVLLVAPVWLTWSRSDLAWSTPMTPARMVESAAAVLALLSISTLVFLNGVGSIASPRLLSRPYQVLPVALWIALRFGPRGAALSVLAVAILAAGGTALGGGAYVLVYADPSQRPLLTQGFITSLALGCMALAVSIDQALSQGYQTRLLNASLAEANRDLVREIEERERTALSLRVLLDAVPEGIVVVDAAGAIVDVNHALETMVGYGRLQLIGHHSAMLVAESDRDAVRRYQERYAAAPESLQAGPDGRDLTARRRDGSTFAAQVGLRPYHVGDQLRIIATVRDVTEQRAVERRMETSLREKEVLLREVHHRVKNNMAVMSSLLYLQSRHATDPETVRVFRESESRVRSMAMVHEVLYRSGDLSSVDFGHYLQSLVDHLANMYRATLPALRVEQDIQPLRLSIDQAIPCGLLLNELLTNAFKHAFVDGLPPVLHVSARSRGGQVRIDLLDNGVGMPDGAGRATQTLGMRLTQALVEQVDGTITHERQARGTRTSVTFPLILGTSMAGTVPARTSA